MQRGDNALLAPVIRENCQGSSYEHEIYNRITLRNVDTTRYDSISVDMREIFDKNFNRDNLRDEISYIFSYFIRLLKKIINIKF